MPIDPAAAYDKVADRYDRFYADEVVESVQIFTYVSMLEPGSLMDVGCGTGIAIPFLELPPSQYLGIDVSPEMIRVAREAWPAYDFLIGDFLDYPPLHLRFDFVLSAFGPISHSERLSDWVMQTKRCLLPGGRFMHMAADVDSVRILDDEGIDLPYIRWTAEELGEAFSAQLSGVRVRTWNRWLIVEGNA